MGLPYDLRSATRRHLCKLQLRELRLVRDQLECVFPELFSQGTLGPFWMKACGIRWKGTPAAAALTVSAEKTIAIPLFFRLRQPQGEPCPGALPKIRLSEIPPNDLIIFKGKRVNHDQVNGLSKKPAVKLQLEPSAFRFCTGVTSGLEWGSQTPPVSAYDTP